MKKREVREKVEELKVLLSALTAYGNLNLEAHNLINNHLDGLFPKLNKDEKLKDINKVI